MLLRTPARKLFHIPIYQYIHTHTHIQVCVYVCFSGSEGSSGDLNQRNNLVWFSSNHMKDLTLIRLLSTWAPREGENTPINLNRK